jgi:hypothetical protein
MGASSTLPWIKRTSRKKELRVVSHSLVVSHMSGAAGIVIGLVPAAMLVSGLSTPFRRVIRVHTRVGDMDRGVLLDRCAALVDRATCVVMALGLPDAGAILHEAKVGWGFLTLEFIGAMGSIGEDLLSDGTAMRCRTPSWSVMQERDPKRITSLALKVIRVSKMMAMELWWINITPPTWHASYQCLWPNYALWGSPHDAFE